MVGLTSPIAKGKAATMESDPARNGSDRSTEHETDLIDVSIPTGATEQETELIDLFTTTGELIDVSIPTDGGSVVPHRESRYTSQLWELMEGEDEEASNTSQSWELMEGEDEDPTTLGSNGPQEQVSKVSPRRQQEGTTSSAQNNVSPMESADMADDRHP
ncbi:MAG: hypothetical protein Q9186_004298 [Xanthomendoza sp. 1 TL-2023]